MILFIKRIHVFVDKKKKNFSHSEYYTQMFLFIYIYILNYIYKYNLMNSGLEYLPLPLNGPQ